MIQISDLSFTYAGSGFHLRIPALSIDKAQKTAIIGPSGSGKTTLLNLISGIVRPDNGLIFIEKTRISDFSDAKARVYRIQNLGFVFQDFALLDYLTVMDNILHPFRITKSLKLDVSVKQRARELADRMDIADKLSEYPGSLSHGQKQRVAICRSLITSPKLILADEATGNLDPANKQKILDLLFRQVDENQAALIAVTHDHELLQHFDRVIDFSLFIPGE